MVCRVIWRRSGRRRAPRWWPDSPNLLYAEVWAQWQRGDLSGVLVEPSIFPPFVLLLFWDFAFYFLFLTADYYRGNEEDSDCGSNIASRGGNRNCTEGQKTNSAQTQDSPHPSPRHSGQGDAESAEKSRRGHGKSKDLPQRTLRRHRAHRDNLKTHRRDAESAETEPKGANRGLVFGGFVRADGFVRIVANATLHAVIDAVVTG
jgi:hypothetical protein